MSVFTYVALREFEPTLTIVRTDISVASADDSFNAATGLAGLLDNEWILVLGFTNAVNNGWFQLSANSTATKILQDTTSALITEGAGASITIKGYKRGLGQTYNLESGLETIERNVKVVRSSQQALGGGAPEVLLQRRETFVDVRTVTIEEVNIKQWREFLASVEGGETFTFDPYGTVVSPDEPLPAILDSESYAEAREAMFRYRISFRVRLMA